MTPAKVSLASRGLGRKPIVITHWTTTLLEPIQRGRCALIGTRRSAAARDRCTPHTLGTVTVIAASIGG